MSQNGTAVFAQGNGSQPGALIRNYAGGRAILAQVNAGESAIVGENTGSGPGVRGQSTTAAVMAVASGSGAGVDVFAASGPVLRGDAGGVSNSGLRELITLSTRPVFDNSVEAGYGGSIRITAQFSPVLFGTLAQMRAEMLGGPSAGARGALSIWQGAGAVDAIAYDGQDSATQTGLLVRHDGSQVRVKVGPAGSGPGGSGRALYID
ncbi:MAG TPA: hypothetical protein VFS21_35990 [Roseiflexaceae bacterium]|nr:hypothetical protein [Roseiflexaceae bacterium]